MVNLGTLKSALNYDPETGLWTWLVTRGRARSGSPAGSVHKAKKSIAVYLKIRINGRDYLAHRLAFLYMTGEWPKGEPDHRNMNGMDNRWVNLRDSTPSQNKANRAAKKGSYSGIKGVSYCKRDDLYHAEIKFNGARIHLGYFKEARLAGLAYANAATELHGDFARVA